MRVPRVSEKKGEGKIPVWHREDGPWAVFWLGPKCCPAALLHSFCFFFFSFMFSILFISVFCKRAPKQIKPKYNFFSKIQSNIFHNKTNFQVKLYKLAKGLYLHNEK
jgi:hypothetical protein